MRRQISDWRDGGRIANHHHRHRHRRFTATHLGFVRVLTRFVRRSAAPLRAAPRLRLKRRTTTESHDLDLTYITPRVIALGLPASGVEALYRNPLQTVRDFLDSKHANKYAMVNLCDERDYSDTDWPMAARVFRFPFADHHTCCMSALHAFCERAATFLAADEEHVLAVHCKVRARLRSPLSRHTKPTISFALFCAQAGKGRTGVMVAAYLLFAGEYKSPDDALQFFRVARTTDLDAVNNPSQCHYVRLYSRLLAGTQVERPLLISGPTMTLYSITLSTAPAALSGLPSIYSASSTAQQPKPYQPAPPPVATATAPAADAPKGGDGKVEGGSEEGGEKSPSADSGSTSSGSGGGGSVSSLASFVVPWWHLKIAIYHLTPVDTAEGGPLSTQPCYHYWAITMRAKSGRYQV